MIALPLSSDPAQIFVTQLGSVKYLFEVKYNDRNAVWTMDILDDVTQLPIIRGLPLVLGQDLLEPYNFGMGGLFVIDETSSGKEATTDDLGDRVNVYWLSPEELATL